ncbi:MAG: alkaline phosphatase [Rikenellaceae bacterium]|nr:alkaline phosphatase [Rikenellaceae bacterium]
MKPIYTLLFALPLLLAGCAPRAEAPEVKNLIFLIGDGMGLAQYAMLEIEQDYAPNAFTEADHVALTTTRSANNRVTDSAAAGTALATGHKTNNSMLGMLPDSTEVESMMERARDCGKATGLIASCYLQHATPASFYAHVPRRHLYEQITDHLALSRFDVLIGGGMRWLTEEHLAHFNNEGYVLAKSIEEVEATSSSRIAGILADEYLAHAPERGDVIPRATKKALETLAQDPDGFMLMVEGSQIDGAGHANDPHYLLAEMEDFEQVVRIAVDFTRSHPGTLLVVTADHETGGLSLPSGKSDFTLSESGIDYRFGTGSHSAIRVPAYLYGTGADGFEAMMDNTELSHRIEELMGLRK